MPPDQCHSDQGHCHGADQSCEHHQDEVHTAVGERELSIPSSRYMNYPSGVYRGALHCARQTLATEAPLAFYKGFQVSCMRLVCHFSYKQTCNCKAQSGKAQTLLLWVKQSLVPELLPATHPSMAQLLFDY